MQPDKQLPSVSVIVPCRDEELFIALCLDSILANEYPHDRLEIIVVDGMSRDRTRHIVAQYAKRYAYLRLVDNTKSTIPAAMNRGIEESSGQVVLKMDAHASYPPDYITECVGNLFAYRADMTGGVWSIVPRKQTLMSEAIALGLPHWFASGSAYIKTGSGEPRWADAAAFGCWRRETLEKLGPFDEHLTRNSDMEFNLRLRNSGGRILLVPQIKITYYADADLKSFWKHNLSDGFWTTYALRFGKQASSWRHWVPLVFVLSLLAWIPSLIVVPSAGRVLLCSNIAYVLVNLAVAVQLSVKNKNWRYMSVLPIVFATRHVAHGVGGLYGALLVVMPDWIWGGWRSAAANKKDTEYRGKRLLDVAGSLVGLIVCCPLLAMLSLLIKLDSAGPAIYMGERLGRHGKSFKMLKLRTMCCNGSQADPPITPEDDRRITRIGAILRKLKLDELPQLINVLRGEMSLVGPRPESPFYFQFYTVAEKDELLSVRPGMTDYGSLRFHDEGAILAGVTDPVKAYVECIRDQKVREQLRYLKERSFLTDLKIIVITVMTIVTTRFRRNAAEDRPPPYEV
jgi:lipopolysaccharide/colanic/teichoic acid biosynthesis glycosyltransferase/glycosyltransferase involved in cell wall biosynthesis